jgi:hypothetical protein
MVTLRESITSPELLQSLPTLCLPGLIMAITWSKVASRSTEQVIKNGLQWVYSEVAGNKTQEC